MIQIDTESGWVIEKTDQGEQRYPIGSPEAFYLDFQSVAAQRVGQ